MLRIVPVLLSGLDIVWPLLEEGLLAIEAKGGEQEEPVPVVRAGIERGMYLPFFVYRDKRYIGFIIGKINQTPQNLEFCIYKGYKIPGEDWLEPSFFLQLKSIIQQFNCTVISFYSTRRGWEKAAARLGFKQGYTQYLMEV